MPSDSTSFKHSHKCIFLAQLAFIKVLFQIIEMVFHHFNLSNGHFICFFEAKEGLIAEGVLVKRNNMYLLMEIRIKVNSKIDFTGSGVEE